VLLEWPSLPPSVTCHSTGRSNPIQRTRVEILVPQIAYAIITRRNKKRFSEAHLEDELDRLHSNEKVLYKFLNKMIFVKTGKNRAT
jgi:hypothetical protein